MPLKKQPKNRYKTVKRIKHQRITPSYFLMMLFVIVFIFIGTLYFLAQETAEVQVSQDEPVEEQFIVQIADYAQVLQKNTAFYRVSVLLKRYLNRIGVLANFP